MPNQTIMQYFEWYLPNDGNHWKRLANDAKHLSSKGISKVWMPPAFKATNANDVGYGIYDLFDLGEFEQKGTVRTKYGDKHDYLEAIKCLKDNGIEPIADIVLNHKAAADRIESFEVIEVDANDRNRSLSDPFVIKGWTHFNFEGRKKTYNDFEWHWYHFTGTDYDAKTRKSGVYLIQGDNKGWANENLVDSENGNYDYLMYADLDFKHPEVIQNLYDWAEWFIETTGIRGFRLDAIKHIDSFFIANFIRDIREKQGKDFYVFGEFWNPDETANTDYLESVGYQFDLVDVRLHQNFYDASHHKDFDLRLIFEGTLVKNHPTKAVTFVDNHDTQRGQALESTVKEWFKPAAYALILLREAGLPCVFYGDYYGIKEGYPQQAFTEVIDLLLQLRQDYAYGKQVDYFDDSDCIGWVRLGDEEHANPLAVLVTNGTEKEKRMFVGQGWANHHFYNALNRQEAPITIDEEGWGIFTVAAESISAWIPDEV